MRKPRMGGQSRFIVVARFDIDPLKARRGRKLQATPSAPRLRRFSARPPIPERSCERLQAFRRTQIRGDNVTVSECRANAGCKARKSQAAKEYILYNIGH